MAHSDGLYEGHSTAEMSSSSSSFSVAPYPTNSPPPSQAPAATLHSSLPSLDSDHVLNAQSSLLLPSSSSSSSSSSSLPQSESPDLSLRSIADHVNLSDVAAEPLSARRFGESSFYADERGLAQAFQLVPKCVKPLNSESHRTGSPGNKAIAAPLKTSTDYSLSQVQEEMARMANDQAARRAKVDRQLSERNMQLLRKKRGDPLSPQPQASPTSHSSTDIQKIEARLQESLRRVGELEGYVRSLQEKMDAAHRIIRDCMTERESLREKNRALKKRIIDNRSHISWLLSGKRTVSPHARQSSQNSLPQSTTYPPSSQSASQRSASDYEGLDIILAAANSSDHGDLPNNSFYKPQQRHLPLSQQSAISLSAPVHPPQGHIRDDYAVSTHQPKLYMYSPQPQNTRQSGLPETTAVTHHNDDATIVGSGSSDDETVEHEMEPVHHSRTSHTTENDINSWSTNRNSDYSKRKYNQSTIYQYSRVDKPGVSGRKKMMHER